MTASPSAPAPQIARCIRPDVLAMKGYHVQPSQGLVKLDAMENPFALPPALQCELGERLSRVPINRYPGERIAELKATLAAHIGLAAGRGLMLGNGSDELISLLALACHQPGATILAPVPGFVMYEMSAKLQGLRFVGVPLQADFELDAEAMRAAIAEHRPVITYLAYPNNPTGNLWDDAVIEAVIRQVGEQGGLVVLDEAYQPFAARTWMDRAAAFDHVLVMRTLSKFGLAGIRLGYMVGATALIDELDKVRPPYNVNLLSAEAALFALEHADEFAAQAAVLRSERARLLVALNAIDGVTALPSEGNMMLFKVADPARCFERIRAHGVLIKNVSSSHPLLAGCLRLTVGTPTENDQLIDAVQASVKASE